MVIVALNRRLRLLETNVVEPGERGATDILDGVIRHQEVLLPPHKNVVRVRERLIIEVVRVESFGVLRKGRKFALQLISQGQFNQIKTRLCWFEMSHDVSVFRLDTTANPSF